MALGQARAPGGRGGRPHDPDRRDRRSRGLRRRSLDLTALAARAVPRRDATGLGARSCRRAAVGGSVTLGAHACGGCSPATLATRRDRHAWSRRNGGRPRSRRHLLRELLGLHSGCRTVSSSTPATGARPASCSRGVATLWGRTRSQGARRSHRHRATTSGRRNSAGRGRRGAPPGRAPRFLELDPGTGVFAKNVADFGVRSIDAGPGGRQVLRRLPSRPLMVRMPIGSRTARGTC
jgi:hypothetical protein